LSPGRRSGGCGGGGGAEDEVGGGMRAVRVKPVMASMVGDVGGKWIK
jgi:hypothetical protein